MGPQSPSYDLSCPDTSCGHRRCNTCKTETLRGGRSYSATVRRNPQQDSGRPSAAKVLKGAKLHAKARSFPKKSSKPTKKRDIDDSGPREPSDSGIDDSIPHESPSTSLNDNSEIEIDTNGDGPPNMDDNADIQSGIHKTYQRLLECCSNIRLATQLPPMTVDRDLSPIFIAICMVMIMAVLGSGALKALSVYSRRRSSGKWIPHLVFVSCLISIVLVWLVMLAFSITKRVEVVRMRLQTIPASLSFHLVPKGGHAVEKSFELRIFPLKRFFAEFWTAGCWIRTPPKLDHVRVSFRCVRGRVIWSDYPPEYHEGAARLQKELNGFLTRAQGGRSSKSGESLISRSGNLLVGIPFPFGVLKDRLKGRSRDRSPDSEAQLRKSQRVASRIPTDFYLTCCRQESDRVPWLFQLPSHDIDRDAAYFEQLRTLSRNLQHRWRYWLAPRKIVKIKYVQVSAVSSEVFHILVNRTLM